MAAEPRDVEDLVVLAARLLGEPSPIWDLGLLGLAAALPAASAFGEEAYLDISLKAAAPLRSLVEDHPLVDGNARLGRLSTAVFFELNGIDATQTRNDDLLGLGMSVVASQCSVEESAGGLCRTVR